MTRDQYNLLKFLANEYVSTNDTNEQLDSNFSCTEREDSSAKWSKDLKIKYLISINFIVNSGGAYPRFNVTDKGLCYLQSQQVADAQISWVKLLIITTVGSFIGAIVPELCKYYFN